ncbi:uncharacterized protein LOC119732582 [Patiria miniata]|uniref:Ig-like domain-containing protein n=1 Tax=Patiria miniata TaxID=46514 RepID=A0A914AFC9_PATMI|nr:uncharacterized protein LOC119732582 [Patiria miniata]
MDARLFVCSMLVGFLCLNALVMVAVAQTVSAWIVEPRSNGAIKEGDVVHMTCVARYLYKYHTLEWVTGSPPYHTLRWGRASITTDPRFVFETTERPTSRLLVIQDFTITNVKREDSGEYVCNVKNINTDPGDNIEASASINLSVLYFPSQNFPICFPDGPITLTPGPELTMRCTSEAGNPQIAMDISQECPSSDYAWTTSNMNGTISMSLDLAGNSSNNGIAFVCSISSLAFPDLRRSCTIGHISVEAVTEPVTEPTTDPMTETTTESTSELTREVTTPAVYDTVTSLTPAPFVTYSDTESTETSPYATEAKHGSTLDSTHAEATGKTAVKVTNEPTAEPEATPSTMFRTVHDEHTGVITTMTSEPTYSLLTFASDDPSPLTPWIPAFVAATSALLVSIMTIVILVLCLIKLMKRLKASNDSESQNPIIEPYMELQPTDIKA